MTAQLKKKFLLMLVFLLILSACSKTSDNVVQDDILTQKATEEGRTQISVLVKYAFSANAFEKAVEEQFPDIDIVQVGNYTANTTLAKEYETRLKHDDLTDIVMTWPLDVGKEYWEERLLDLSGMPFTSRYQRSSLDSIVVDDKLYYLPGPAGIRAIVYNKTMFEENGWKVPTNYDEFVELCKTIEASGIRAFELALGNEEVLDTAFIGFNFGSSFSKPKDTAWLYDYNENQVGNFADQFANALTIFQELIDQKILQPSDLEKHYQDAQQNLFARKTAMIEDSSLLINSGKDMGNETDEFALMPFFNKDPYSDWARIYMLCYIGLNKHLTEDQVKYDKVMKIMDYISSPEGQAALSGDNGFMFSSLLNVSPPDSDELKPLLPALSEGRYAVFPSFKNGQTALRKGLAGMVNGTLEVAEVAKMVDDANKQTASITKGEKLGTASKKFSMIETGNFVTDLMRENAGTDIALFLDNGKDGLLNGKGISAKFYEGDVYEEDVYRVFPDLKYGEVGEMWNIEMTGENLKKTLEYSIKVENKEGWFYYFSGLKMIYDPVAEPGARIKDITMADGTKIDDAKLYTIAVMEESVPEAYIQSKTKSGLLIQDLIKNKIRDSEVITPANDQRLRTK